MADKHVDEYISVLRMNGYHGIADYLHYLKLERDAAVRNLQAWPCNTCSRHGKREFCNVCSRNRVIIARDAGLIKDMYKWRTPQEV
jgi:hypothetical protein